MNTDYGREELKLIQKKEPENLILLELDLANYEEDHLITISFREGSVTTDQLKEVKGILKDKGWSAIVSPN